jgi:hypothetical protein
MHVANFGKNMFPWCCLFKLSFVKIIFRDGGAVLKKKVCCFFFFFLFSLPYAWWKNLHYPEVPSVRKVSFVSR